MPDPIIGMAAQTATNAITGIVNQEMQRAQNNQNAARAYKYSKKMTDYNMQKQLELWEKTGYGPQMEQLKEAGLNPALMYGHAGAGGSTNIATGSQQPAQADAKPIAGMDVASIMQLKLLQAQKENIEADTKNKESQTDNYKAQTEGQGIENAFKSYMMSTSPEGEENVNIGKSTRGQQESENVNRTRTENRFRMDENERQALMNSKVMEEIGQRISLMAKQGMTQEEIYKNLQKEGKLLDAEIEWNALDINSGNVGKFLMNIIKMALKPR